MRKRVKAGWWGSCIPQRLENEQKKESKKLRNKVDNMGKHKKKQIKGSWGDYSKFDPYIDELQPGKPAQMADTGKVDLKEYKDKVPVDEMQWKAFGSPLGVYGVFKFAQQKYGNVSSWRNRSSDSKSKYLSAMIRHYFEIKNGEEIDPESGLHHGAAMAWNALSYLEFVIEDMGEK